MSDVFTAKELKERIEKNDRRCTAEPYLLLLQEKETYVAHDDYAYPYEDKWVEEYTGDYHVESSREALIDYFKESYGDEYDDISKELEGKIKPFKEGYHWNTVNVFLTDEGYKDHKKMNSHNLREHRTYGIHAFRNKEIRSIFALIDGSEKLQAENENYKEVHKEWERKFREGVYLTEAEYIKYVGLKRKLDLAVEALEQKRAKK